MRPNNLIKLVLWIVFFEVIGFLLGSLTQANIHPWYESLHKSSLTPPGFVFSIVWTILYALLATIAFLLSRKNKKLSKLMIKLYALQTLMNWAWTPLFFSFHWLTFSAIWLLGLTFLNCILMIKASREDKKIAGLLSPYLLWLGFACYLNVIVALQN